MIHWRRPRSLFVAVGALAALGVGFVTLASAHVRGQAAGLIARDPAALPPRAVAIVLGARVWDRGPPRRERRRRARGGGADLVGGGLEPGARAARPGRGVPGLVRAPSPPALPGLADPDHGRWSRHPRRPLTACAPRAGTLSFRR